MTEQAGDRGAPRPRQPRRRARADQPGQRADPYLKSMLLGLIEDSYLHTGTFTQFAAEVLQVIAYAATVPVAFTEGSCGLPVDRPHRGDRRRADQDHPQGRRQHED